MFIKILRKRGEWKALGYKFLIAYHLYLIELNARILHNSNDNPPKFVLNQQSKVNNL